MNLISDQKKAKMLVPLDEDVEELLDWQEKNERPKMNSQACNIVMRLLKNNS